MSNNKKTPNRSLAIAACPRGAQRGLPEREDLEVLAMTYLVEQGKYWPALIGSTQLPSACAESAGRLANEFEHRLMDDAYMPSPVRVPTAGCNEVGAAYVRYSDANSNVRSLDQQLINILGAAHRQQIFVPWGFLFADAAISGTVESRPGFQQLVKTIEAKGCVTTAIVDELDRLSRDQGTSTKFRKLLEKHDKRLLTSHGFDSTEQGSKVTYAFSSLMSDVYIDQLKLKVDRGMTYAVSQGKHVSSPPLGYRLQTILDEHGQPVLSSSRKVKSRCVIDPQAADVVRRIFSLYAESKRSPAAIARLFNEEAVMGKTTWNTSAVATYLTHELYIGVLNWKRTRNYVDSETGKRSTTSRPQGQQLRTDVPELRIISDELWQAAINRKKEVSRKTFNPGKATTSRQSQYPTRLFDLYCRDCNKPLRLYRAGDYAQLECTSRSDGKKGCSLSVSKSLRTIDECILAELSQQLLDEDTLVAMVSSANEFLAEEAAKPRMDVKEIDRQISEVTKKIERMAGRLADLATGPASDVIVQKIGVEQHRLEQLQAAKELATEQNFRPEPLTLVGLQGLMVDLRQLLHESIVAAHEVLAKALGPVYVHLGPKRGKRFSWIAELNIDPLPVMVEIAGRKNCPSTPTLEYLRVRGWTMSQTVETELRHWGQAERYTKTVGEMLAAGSTPNMISIALEIDPASVDAAAAHYAAGTACNLPPRNYGHRRTLPASRVEQIAADVVRMKDIEGLSFKAIAAELKASEGLVSRSYKQAKSDQTLEAVRAGRQFKVAPPLKLPKEVHERIQELLQAGGMSYRAIAREVGCDHHAVSEAHKRMKAKDAA
jgi:DNA invertase Pin-like site-specific DNA recombinase